MKKLCIILFLISTISYQVAGQDSASNVLSQYLKMIDLRMNQDELDSLQANLEGNLGAYEALHKVSLPNHVPPVLQFIPPLNPERLPNYQGKNDYQLSSKVKRPKDDAALAFLSVADLSVLIKNKKLTSLELTNVYLDRLRRFGDTLECIITITEEVALAQAKQADEEIAKGTYRGTLHGIPYGIKDLLATKEHLTTWGAEPYKDQRLDQQATVVTKLQEAGAVLVAKLTLGALAWGDVWYGGVTRNPWNLEQGSSGSSAGSASATVAGLVPFAIGSETLGSIVSPSTRCGATGLRPTFGRVSKSGAMALSWSMDKLGPICRNATDLALVIDVIKGADSGDLGTREFPLNYQYSEENVKKLRVGYLKSYFDQAGFNHANDSVTIDLLKSNGIELIEKSLPEVPAQSMSMILAAEAAAAFDELTRSNQDSLLVRQIRNAWPNVFRAARFTPAVEYINANRVRYQLIEAFNEMMADIDVLVTPTYAGPQLLMTNLSGHPAVVIPNGSYKAGNPGSISFIANHFDEGSIMTFARWVQELTPYEEEHPSLFME